MPKYDPKQLLAELLAENTQLANTKKNIESRLAVNAEKELLLTKLFLQDEMSLNDAVTKNYQGIADLVKSILGNPGPTG